MNILTVIIVAGLGVSFLFSAVVLAAFVVSSRSSREEYIVEQYELEREAYALNSVWVAES